MRRDFKENGIMYSDGEGDNQPSGLNRATMSHIIKAVSAMGGGIVKMVRFYSKHGEIYMRVYSTNPINIAGNGFSMVGGFRNTFSQDVDHTTMRRAQRLPSAIYKIDEEWLPGR
ncbi:MAG: hypothetical protein MPK62_01380 [Alphaproteobacteria bacterium]|nr:hypothetical protein [Alphaproteobacteria bacterium]MDA8029787.1 hypothetical protein [Alphaproteobacteria bacterium]